MSYTIDYPFTTEVKQYLSQYCNVHNFSSKKDDSENFCEEKYLVSYNKHLIDFKSDENKNKIGTIGLLRSVIFLNGKLVSFSPPKAIPFEEFSQKYEIDNPDVIIEEFVEGTMINLYYNTISKKWEISTKNNIGGNNSFYEDNPYSFSEMFHQSILECNLNLNELDKNYCYSFVMMHPLNNLVSIIGDKPKLYLIEIYHIEYLDEINTKINIINKNEFIKDKLTMQKLFIPHIFNVPSVSNSFDSLTFIDLGVYVRKYSNMGFIIKNVKTGERSKIRNPYFEKVQMLRGNQPSSLYHFLSLRKQNKLNEFLEYFPEKINQFSNYKEILYNFTNDLHQKYLFINVHKIDKFSDCHSCFKRHIYKLHECYINGIKTSNKIKIDKKFVINYVNSLDTTNLFKSLKEYFIE